MNMARNGVFISYSHQDTHWLEEIKTQLKPLQLWHETDIWDDTKLVPGGHWKSEIKSAMKGARVAILLVSSNFLASDFIAKEELPPLLMAAKREGASIFMLIIDKCAFELTPLEPHQCVHDKSQPLEFLKKRKRQTVFVDLVKLVKDAFDKRPTINIKQLPDYFYNISLLILIKQTAKTISDLEKSTQFKRERISSSLYAMEEEGLVFRERLQTTKKPSTMWRASEYGKHVVDELEKINQLSQPLNLQPMQ